MSPFDSEFWNSKMRADRLKAAVAKTVDDAGAGFDVVYDVEGRCPGASSDRGLSHFMFYATKTHNAQDGAGLPGSPVHTRSFTPRRTRGRNHLHDPRHRSITTSGLAAFGRPPIGSLGPRQLGITDDEEERIPIRRTGDCEFHGRIGGGEGTLTGARAKRTTRHL